MKRAVLEHFKNGRGALIQTEKFVRFVASDLDHIMAIPGTAPIKVELVNSPERLGDEFENFFDYAICKLKNEFALYPKIDPFLRVACRFCRIC